MQLTRVFGHDTRIPRPALVFTHHLCSTIVVICVYCEGVKSKRDHGFHEISEITRVDPIILGGIWSFKFDNSKKLLDFFKIITKLNAFVGNFLYLRCRCPEAPVL